MQGSIDNPVSKGSIVLGIEQLTAVGLGYKQRLESTVAALQDIALGADMMLQMSMSDRSLQAFAREVKRVAEAALEGAK